MRVHMQRLRSLGREQRKARLEGLRKLRWNSGPALADCGALSAAEPPLPYLETEVRWSPWRLQCGFNKTEVLKIHAGHFHMYLWLTSF